MWRHSIMLACGLLGIVLLGCGEDPRVKRNQAQSQVNVLGEKLSGDLDADGWFVQTKETEKDPWGNDLVVKYDRKDKTELLTVRSHGPDGLPLNSDDIVYRFQVSQRTGVEKALEKGAAAGARGLVKGIIEGVRENK